MQSIFRSIKCIFRSRTTNFTNFLWQPKSHREIFQLNGFSPKGESGLFLGIVCCLVGAAATFFLVGMHKSFPNLQYRLWRVLQCSSDFHKLKVVLPVVFYGRCSARSLHSIYLQRPEIFCEFEVALWKLDIHRWLRRQPWHGEYPRSNRHSICEC